MYYNTLYNLIKNFILFCFINMVHGMELCMVHGVWSVMLCVVLDKQLKLEKSWLTQSAAKCNILNEKSESTKHFNFCTTLPRFPLCDRKHWKWMKRSCNRLNRINMKIFSFRVISSLSLFITFCQNKRVNVGKSSCHSGLYSL